MRVRIRVRHRDTTHYANKGDCYIGEPVDGVANDYWLENNVSPFDSKIFVTKTEADHAIFWLTTYNYLCFVEDVP